MAPCFARIKQASDKEGAEIFRNEILATCVPVLGVSVNAASSKVALIPGQIAMKQSRICHGRIFGEQAPVCRMVRHTCVTLAQLS